MKSIFLLSLLALVGVHANAKPQANRKPASGCPVTQQGTGRVDAIVQAISKAPTCYEASEIASGCAYGSSADSAIAGAAVDVCAKDYKSISASDQKLFAALGQKCVDKYAGQQGTMYRSMNAFCHLEISKLFSGFYSPLD